MIQFADRLNNIEEYYFSKKLKEVGMMVSEGKPIINIAIGSPDLAPPKAVLKTIKDSLHDEKAHQYQSYLGLPEFREAIADFYEKKYNVNLNPTNEILPLMGSKEGILHISLALLNKNDKVLVPNPGYPTYSSVTKLVGATPVYYNLCETMNYQPNFSELEKQDLSNVKIMWVNYPHMPTGAKGTYDTFQKLIAFGKKHRILIVNDNPYSFILNKNPQSILNVNGAKEIALELNSMSKSFNIAGWRIGMLLGNAHYISEILKVKTQQDSGMFYSIQKGAITALKTSDHWFNSLNDVYEKRRKLVWKIADKLNCTYHKDTAGMFVWAKLPNGMASEEMVNQLLSEKNVFITPGNIFGCKGEGYIRLSLCAPEEKIREIINRF